MDTTTICLTEISNLTHYSILNTHHLNEDICKRRNEKHDEEDGNERKTIKEINKEFYL